MSGVAALDDIHGNLPALDAVLAEPRREPPDAVVVGGDIAAGPMPHEVLGRLRELPWRVHCLRGNADRAVVMGFDGTIPPELRESTSPSPWRVLAEAGARVAVGGHTHRQFDRRAGGRRMINAGAEASLIAPADNPLRGVIDDPSFRTGAREDRL